jgi:hypothetical protein
MFILVGEEKVTEVQRKRHYGLDVSLKGRVRKLTKMGDGSDDGMDAHSPRKFLENLLIPVTKCI